MTGFCKRKGAWAFYNVPFFVGYLIPMCFGAPINTLLSWSWLLKLTDAMHLTLEEAKTNAAIYIIISLVVTKATTSEKAKIFWTLTI